MSSSDDRIGLFHDRKIEASVLNLLIQFAKGPQGDILHVLAPSDFFYYQRFFQLLLELNETDIDFSMQNMAALLVNRGHSSLLNAFEVISLVEVYPHQMLLYISTLKRMGKARELMYASIAIALDNALSSEYSIEIMKAIDKVLHEQPSLPFELDPLKISESIQVTESILRNVPVNVDFENSNLRKALRNWIQRFEKDCEANQESRFHFQIPGTDETKAGLLRNNLYLVCGETASGKTTFLVNFLVQNAKVEKNPLNDTVLFISTKPQSHLISQLIAVSSGIEYYKLCIPGFFADNNWSELIKGTSRLLAGLNIIFIDSLDSHFCDADALIRNVTEVWRLNEALSLIVVDDADRLLTSETDKLNPWKELAETMGVPVIATITKKFDELTLDSSLPADVIIGVNKTFHNQKNCLQLCSFFSKVRCVHLKEVPIYSETGENAETSEELSEEQTIH